VYVTGERACAELIFYSSIECNTAGYLHVTPVHAWYVQHSGVRAVYSKNYSEYFDEYKWHHFKLSYNTGRIHCRMDGDSLFTDTCRVAPKAFALASLHEARFANMVVTNTHEEFDNLISNSKLVTHAIHFDANSAMIKPESAIFINDLAKWLNSHPTVKLEIDGHTDSDGNVSANMKLSQARADAIKKQLVALGVAATRLTTKGYGASKPLQPNTTDAGKAENRRVEFIKQ
jgi:outer membrane protein OmpA-like peptidoglycan-associated protein